MSGDADYDATSEDKRAFWAARDDFSFLEYSKDDLLRLEPQGLAQDLLHRLQEMGIPCERRSEEEIWELVRHRAVDSFTGAIRAFIGRCRKLNLGPEALRQLIADHTPSSKTEELFLDVAASVHAGYLARLAHTGEEDFDGLLWRAVEAVEGGQTRFVRNKGRERGDLGRLRFLLVDEYQDLSPGFARLIDAIRASHPGVASFGVGDDWQAINGFAGSDLKFFREFQARHEDGRVYRLPTNYRSAEAIVRVGNSLMSEHGEPARPHRTNTGEALLADMADFQPTAAETQQHDGDDITPAVLRLTWRAIKRGSAVRLLLRTNTVPWYVTYPSAAKATNGIERFVEHVRSFLPEEDRHLVSGSTVHKFKGLQRPTVILLDGLDQRFPLIHRNWVFQRLFGDSVAEIAAEERRLFYVALTRAEDSLVVVTDSLKPSPFIATIGRPHGSFETGGLAGLRWGELESAPVLGGARYELRVFNAFNVKDHLKDLRYRWNANGKYWYRVLPAESFAFDSVLAQSWTDQVGRIEVREGDELRFLYQNPNAELDQADGAKAREK